MHARARAADGGAGWLQVAFMFNEWYKPASTLQFPVGGSQEMAHALARAVRRRGGAVHCGARVEAIELDAGGVATGVRVRGGARVAARRAVVTNATLWDTRALLPPGALPPPFAADVAALPPCRSFMHLHVGFDGAGLTPRMHHIVVNTWDGGVDCEQNVVLISIASVADAALAPPGKHVLHAYTPATEPYALWEGLDRRSDEYKRLKEERSQVRAPSPACHAHSPACHAQQGCGSPRCRHSSSPRSPLRHAAAWGLR